MKRLLMALALLGLASGAWAQEIRYTPPAPLQVVSGVPTLTQTGDDTAPLGAELVTNGTFATDASGWTATNWTWGAGKIDHDTGNTSALSQSITVTSGSLYLIVFTMVDRTAGSLTGITVGAVTIDPARISTWATDGTYSRSFVATGATGAQTLAFTPDSAFNGALDNIRVKEITGTADPMLTAADSSGDGVFEIRGSYIAGGVLGTLGIGDDALKYNLAAGNLAVGFNALAANTSGVSNVAIGYRSMLVNTLGEFNVALGGDTLLANTTGYQTIAIGDNTLHGNTTGFTNTAVGYAAMYENTTGTGNVAIGARSLYSGTTAANSSNNAAIGKLAGFLANSPRNVFIGADSGYTSGATPSTANAVTTGDNMTFVGYQAGLGSATQGTNKTCIGYQCYVSNSNEVALGDENVTRVLASSDGGATVTSGGWVMQAVLFAALGTPANGTFYYCSDCTIANPCAGSGTGALAKRLNGAWVCN